MLTDLTTRTPTASSVSTTTSARDKAATNCLKPDVGRTISAGISHLVGECWASRLGAEIDTEILVQRETSVVRVHVHQYHRRTVPVSVQLKINLHSFVCISYYVNCSQKDVGINTKRSNV